MPEISPAHELKIWPEYFKPVSSGRKTFELRKNDRDFKLGDHVRLREWDPLKREYTGRVLDMSITYILDGPLAPKDLTIFSIVRRYC